jgi:tRNA pseudouridine55 synthase
MDGFLLIDKPIGMTSHDVVAKVKRKFNLKKVGHTGTLDPFASGLLILCVGKATKLASLFSNLDKSYTGIISFFKHYDTYDVTGKVMKESVVKLDQNELNKIAKSMETTYQQYPPMYSAIKIKGKKLYELAREGIEIERPSRTVHIYNFKIGTLENDELNFYTHVSKGTYIRSLAVDYAQKLNTYAALKALRRTQVGPYLVENAKSLDLVEVRDMMTLEAYFKNHQMLELSDYLIQLVKNGVYLDQRQITTSSPFVVIDKNKQMIAYYEVIEENKYKPVLIF